MFSLSSFIMREKLDFTGRETWPISTYLLLILPVMTQGHFFEHWGLKREKSFLNSLYEVIRATHLLQKPFWFHVKNLHHFFFSHQKKLCTWQQKGLVPLK